MLTDKMYEIGLKYNLITKYDVEYDKRAIQDFVCAIRLLELIDSGYADTEQKAKLNVILNNLIVL